MRRTTEYTPLYTILYKKIKRKEKTQNKMEELARRLIEPVVWTCYAVIGVATVLTISDDKFGSFFVMYVAVGIGLYHGLKAARRG